MEQYAYRSYTADLLKVIAESMGAEVNSRFVDIVDLSHKEDTRSADEIALEVIEKAGLKGQ